jgi:hypothetical protein
MRVETIGDCTIHPYQQAVYIYAIAGQSVVYVGSTTQGIKRRMTVHIRDAKNGSLLPIHQWLLKNNFKCSVYHLETASTSSRERAEKKWIANFDGLLNLTDGGKGMSGHRFAGSSHANKIRDKLRKGKFHNCAKCGLEFWRKPSDKKSNTLFCSTLCSNARHK